MNELQRRPVVVMNFSGIYRWEPFALDKRLTHIDCSDISGTDGYCTREAAEKINKRIAKLGPEGIHFIDNGNYHYVTKLWTNMIREPFRLILFDHHTDMQPLKIPGLLSCGSWVREMLIHNKNLREVMVLGTPAGAERKATQEWGNRVLFDDEELIHRHQIRIPKDVGRLPVYVSIDKDVLSTKDAETNWDQGKVTLAELKAILESIFAHERVIGMDVCGEYDLGHSLFEEKQAADIDSRANETILKEAVS
jgi:arginase family enzyme